MTGRPTVLSMARGFQRVALKTKGFQIVALMAISTEQQMRGQRI